jgi:hypothetical protein
MERGKSFLTVSGRWPKLLSGAFNRGDNHAWSARVVGYWQMMLGRVCPAEEEAWMVMEVDAGLVGWLGSVGVARRSQSGG